MCASPLPNLLASRGRGGRRGFRRERGGGGLGAASNDDVIQNTDSDAAISRLSAVEVGYLDDPFAKYFVDISSPGLTNRRLPIINRGTYTRTTALDSLIASFLSSDNADTTVPGAPSSRQIISLGSGTDTRAFRLFSKPAHSALVYHEIDFPTICSKKLQTVNAIPVLRSTLPPQINEEQDCWLSRPREGCEFWCHGIDLRHLSQRQDLPGLRTDIPTLIISECCLCYLESSQARDLIRWFTDRVADLGIAIYEPIKPDDSFGRMMVSNFAARRIRMPTLEEFKDNRDQEARLLAAGFKHARALSVEDIFNSWVSLEEKTRIDLLEGLDEVEEWNLLAGHYTVVWGWRGPGFTRAPWTAVPAPSRT